MNVIEINDEIKKIDIKDVDLSSNFMYWITMKPEELKSHNHVFNFHSLVVNECFDAGQNSRIELFDNYSFLVLNIIYYKDSKIVSNELDIFVGMNYIITVAQNDVELLKELEHELINFKQNVIFNSDRSIIKILFYIFDKVIINDYEVVSVLENAADNIEIKILKNPDKRYLNELIYLRRQVHRLRNYITPLRYVGDSLVCNDNNIIDKEHLRYFEQVNHRIEKLINSLDSLVQYLVLVREAFEAEIANKTNELMKIFTIIATIFLPLSLITGFFGMNFQHMYIIQYEWAYHATLGVMVLLPIILYILFKKKNWL